MGCRIEGCGAEAVVKHKQLCREHRYPALSGVKVPTPTEDKLNMEENNLQRIAQLEAELTELRRQQPTAPKLRPEHAPTRVAPVCNPDVVRARLDTQDPRTTLVGVEGISGEGDKLKVLDQVWSVEQKHAPRAGDGSEVNGPQTTYLLTRTTEAGTRTSISPSYALAYALGFEIVMANPTQTVEFVNRAVAAVPALGESWQPTTLVVATLERGAVGTGTDLKAALLDARAKPGDRGRYCLQVIDRPAELIWREHVSVATNKALRNSAEEWMPCYVPAVDDTPGERVVL